MSNKRLLLAEDDDTTRDILKNMLQTLGYDVVAACNGSEALEFFKKEPFLVVLTDIEMPGIDGNELIRLLNEMEDAPIIIVQTVYDDVSQVVETMKKGVFDYIVKPVLVDNISYKIKRAFETAQLRKMNNLLRREKLTKLEAQLEWMNWNQDFLKRDYDRIDKALFKSLHTSFNQGAGFGALITLIQLISSSAVKKGDKYILNEDIFKLINSSAALANKTIDTFSEINNVFNQDIKPELLSIYEIIQLVEIVVDDLKKYSEIKNQKFFFSEKKSVFKEMKIKIDSTSFKKAIRELAINAMKFSKRNTAVYIIYGVENNFFQMSILNEPDENSMNVKGIPIEYERIIFEPFFRMDQNVYEKYDTIDFGLGLTIVEKIIRKHNGDIFVSNVKDSSDLTREAVTKVNFTVKIPFVVS